MRTINEPSSEGCGHHENNRKNRPGDGGQGRSEGFALLCAFPEDGPPDQGHQKADPKV